MKKSIIKIIAIIIVIIAFILVLYLNYDLNKNKIEFQEVNIKIEENENNKVVVSNAKELVEALENSKIQIIELQNDIDLGHNLVEKAGIKSKYIQKHSEPLIHPILKHTGVSKLMLQDKDGLILYSKNGKKLLHTNIIIENSKNIKIDNIKFEELWEWDEETLAEYDRNDWDCITIKNSENIQIKNCEFTKSYDGVVDVKESKNVTIEYCKLDEIDIKNNIFFNSQFDELEKNIDNYPMYKYLREEAKLDIDTIKKLSVYQFKLCLIGAEDFGQKNENIILHDNIFLNVKTRIPQTRNSSVYIYNIYVNSNNINYDGLTQEQIKKVREKYPKIVSLYKHGIIAIQRAYVVAENFIFEGIDKKYMFWRGLSLKNLGKIVVKQDKSKLSNLKEKLENEVGTIQQKSKIEVY